MQITPETPTITTTAATTAAISAIPVAHRPDPARTLAQLERRSFATLATVSSAGHPHVAGVLYEMVGEHLFVNTLRSSRKARNIETSGRAAVCVPIRRVPFGGPPSTVQFQARAEVLSLDDRIIGDLIAEGKLTSLTGHGEMDLPDGCFVRFALPARLHTYGLGMPLRRLIADPLAAGGVVDVTTFGV